VLQIPRLERYYQTILYVLAKILGLTVAIKVMTNVGRIDLTIETAKNIYLFEFKIDTPAEAALGQIEDKLYYQKYLGTDKEIILVGVEFDTKKRNIDRWIINSNC
jgi:hypothetical protein